MSPFVHSLLIVVPAALTDDVNQLALAVGTDPADVGTFGRVWWSADGTTPTHSVAHTRATQALVDRATSKLLPDLLPEGCDRLAAQRALDALTLWDGTGPVPGGIIAVVDQDPHSALAAMGLAPLEAPLP